MSTPNAATGSADLGAKLAALLTEAEDHIVDEIMADLASLSPGTERDVVGSVLGTVLQMREELNVLRQRERTLQALTETARDLISFSDVNDVLRAIVERVRHLFLVDSCYVALMDDEAGEVCMRITLGTLSESIESIRQRPGEGIGGEIIRTGRPIWTDDYLRDPTIKRVPDVAAAVETDGIRSIAGVPIKVGGTTIGALFIANRRPMRFTATEIAMLGTMGDQAAIALENARQFEQFASSVRALRESNESLRTRNAQLEHSMAQRARLISLVLDRVSQQEFVTVVAELVGASVLCYADEHGAVLSQWSLSRATPLLGSLSEVVTEEEAHCSGDGALRLPPGASLPFPEQWIVPVRAGARRLGYLYAAFAEPQGAGLAHGLEQCAQTAGILELLERQMFLAEQEVRGDVIDDLLNRRGSSIEAAERRVRRSGVLDPDASHWVFVLTTTAEALRRQLLETCARLAGQRDGVASEFDGVVVSIVPSALIGDAHEFARLAGVHLRRVDPTALVTVGLSGPTIGFGDIRGMYSEAARCLRLALALGRVGEVVCPDDLGALGLVLESASRTKIEGILESRLGPLLAYDTENGTALLDTLQAYFDAGQNPRGAAELLFVHSNTVYQRLNRIDHVLDTVTWREPGGSLEIRLALEFHRLLQRIPLDDIVDSRNTNAHGDGMHSTAQRAHSNVRAPAFLWPSPVLP